MPKPRRGRAFFIVLATGLGSGYCPFAPGTAGTAMGILFFLGFSQFSPLLYLLTLIAFIFLSAWIAEGGENIFGKKDAPPIVIDEIAGFLVAMLWIPFSWLNVGIGFFLFRLFDILKPFPARLIDKKLPGGWGIVLDDIAAGLYANIILQGLGRWL